MDTRLGPYAGVAERRIDGCWLLRSVDPLRPYPRRFTEYLTRWASERPDAVWLAQRDAHGEWRKLSYSAAFAQIRCGITTRADAKRSVGLHALLRHLRAVGDEMKDGHTVETSR